MSSTMTMTTFNNSNILTAVHC